MWVGLVSGAARGGLPAIVLSAQQLRQPRIIGPNLPRPRARQRVPPDF